MGNTGNSEDCAKLAGSLCGGSVSLREGCVGRVKCTSGSHLRYVLKSFTSIGTWRRESALGDLNGSRKGEKTGKALLFFC